MQGVQCLWFACFMKKSRSAEKSPVSVKKLTERAKKWFGLAKESSSASKNPVPLARLSPRAVSASTRQFSSLSSPSGSPSQFAIEIETFVFGGVYDELYFWDATLDSGNGGPTNNKYNQKWVRGGGGDNAALYGIGTDVILKSPVINISPSMPPTTVSVRVDDGSSILARLDGISISGTTFTLPDMTTSYTSTVVLWEDEVILFWEISFDGGSTWQSIGQTDTLNLYWIPAAPTISKVFDYGIQWACGSVEYSGSTNYVNVLNSAISAWINYQPGWPTPDGTKFPLYINYFDSSGWVLQVLQKDGGQCLSNALLLHYLLESIGVNAGTVEMYWAGTPYTDWNFQGIDPTPPCVNFHADAQDGIYGCNNFNANRAARSAGVAKNPRFSFHSMLVIGTNTYDPSYGLTGAAATADFYNMWNGCSKQMGIYTVFASAYKSGISYC